MCVCVCVCVFVCLCVCKKMYLEEVGCRSMDWIELSQDRERWWALVNEVMNLRVP